MWSGPFAAETAWPRRLPAVLAAVATTLSVTLPAPPSFLMRRSSAFEWFLVSLRCSWSFFLYGLRSAISLMPM